MKSLKKEYLQYLKKQTFKYHIYEKIIDIDKHGVAFETIKNKFKLSDSLFLTGNIIQIFSKEFNEKINIPFIQLNLTNNAESLFYLYNGIIHSYQSIQEFLNFFSIEQRKILLLNLSPQNIFLFSNAYKNIDTLKNIFLFNHLHVDDFMHALSQQDINFSSIFKNIFQIEDIQFEKKLIYLKKMKKSHIIQLLNHEYDFFINLMKNVKIHDNELFHQLIFQRNVLVNFEKKIIDDLYSEFSLNEKEKLSYIPYVYYKNKQKKININVLKVENEKIIFSEGIHQLFSIHRIHFKSYFDIFFQKFNDIDKKLLMKFGNQMVIDLDEIIRENKINDDLIKQLFQNYHIMIENQYIQNDLDIHNDKKKINKI